MAQLQIRYLPIYTMSLRDRNGTFIFLTHLVFPVWLPHWPSRQRSWSRLVRDPPLPSPLWPAAGPRGSELHTLSPRSSTGQTRCSVLPPWPLAQHHQTDTCWCSILPTQLESIREDINLPMKNGIPIKLQPCIAMVKGRHAHFLMVVTYQKTPLYLLYSYQGIKPNIKHFSSIICFTLALAYTHILQQSIWTTLH